MRISRRRFIGFVGAAAAAPSWATLVPVVGKTQAGEVEGALEGGARVFRGVPFAEPPVGDLRFRPPVPVKPWKGIRQAKEFAPGAMQPGKGVSEGCLYLNVWSPAQKGRHPVYVWIHGGGMTGGRSSDPMFDGGRLAEEGVVVVTVAYRLGIFGFLEVSPALGESYRGSANNGVRDVLEALRWVQANIAAFGGDPGKVTIGGESAGAKIVDLLLACESAKGLFHQAISQSGGADRCYSRETSLEVGRGFAAVWQKTGRSAGDLLNADAKFLLEQQEAFLKSEPRRYPLRAQADGDFLPLHPLDGIAKLAKGRRVLIGTNRDESAAFLGRHPAEVTQKELANLQMEQFEPVYRRYDDLYPEMDREQREIRAVTAEEYWVPSVRVADAVARGGGEVFCYRLDYEQTGGVLAGTSPHGFDLHLTWGLPQKNNVDEVADQKMVKQVHAAWVAFLKKTSPVANGFPSWPRYTVQRRETMVLAQPAKIELRPQEPELRLWDAVFDGVWR